MTTIIIIIILILGRYDPKGVLKITDNTKIGTNNQSVQSNYYYYYCCYLYP